MKFVPVDRMDEVLENALEAQPAPGPADVAEPAEKKQPVGELIASSQ